jgi:hypothetical protein
MVRPFLGRYALLEPHSKHQNCNEMDFFYQSLDHSETSKKIRNTRLKKTIEIYSNICRKLSFLQRSL